MIACRKANNVEYEHGFSIKLQPTFTPLFASINAVRYSLCILPCSRRQTRYLEIYNDANGELVNLFRCIKHHADELRRETQFYLNSRQVFDEIKQKQTLDCFTDIQRAAMFYVQVKTSYGASRKTFGCNKKMLNADCFTEISNRLNGVVIENKNFDNLIRVYDRPNAFFYCDPPYHTTERFYDIPFTESEHELLKHCLNGINGRFLLSYNDDEYIRNLYSDFNITAVERQNNLSSGTFCELLIRNY